MLHITKFLYTYTNTNIKINLYIKKSKNLFMALKYDRDEFVATNPNRQHHHCLAHQ